MELAALTFSITNREGDLVALAVLCVEARYCSTFSKRMDRPARHFVNPAQWREVQHQIGTGLPTHALPSDSPITRLLVDRVEPQSVSWLGTTPLTMERPGDAATALDHHLKTSLQAYQPRLRQLQDRGDTL